MLYGVFVLLILSLITYLGLFSRLIIPASDRRFISVLYLYHILLAIVYYIYATFNPSDSKAYFRKAIVQYKGSIWFDYFGTSTDFVEFIAFGLVNKLAFTYESCMVFFAWLGFVGFVFFYLFFKEQFSIRPKIFGFDSIKIVFLLPNLHFWSASLGKGSLIFFAFGLFFYGISQLNLQRLLSILVAGWMIFQIRPHIFFVILIAIALGYIFSIKGPGFFIRVFTLVLATGLLVYIYNDIVSLTGLEDEFFFDADFSHRASELAKASSGIDISNYSLPEKLFAFCFRPLFFDAPGFLGFVVSFENLFYLIMFANLFKLSGLRFLFGSSAIIKTCFLTFLGVSLALAQITGNLGLAMRQKSQVMILMMFVILKFLEHQEIINLKKIRKRRQLALHSK